MGKTVIGRHHYFDQERRPLRRRHLSQRREQIDSEGMHKGSIIVRHEEGDGSSFSKAELPRHMSTPKPEIYRITPTFTQLTSCMCCGAACRRQGWGEVLRKFGPSTATLGNEYALHHRSVPYIIIQRSLSLPAMIGGRFYLLRLGTFVCCAHVLGGACLESLAHLRVCSGVFMGW